MEKCVEDMDSKKKYILFGAGFEGIGVLHILGNESVAFFCDSFSKEERIEGIPVIDFLELKVIHNDYQVVVAVTNPSAVAEICRLLNENCIPYAFPVEVYREKQMNLSKIKQEEEFRYWEKLHDWYKTVNYKDEILYLAGKDDDEFLSEKVIADFGCGPLGTLAWTDKPLVKLGIDVLAARYGENFLKGKLAEHGMIYVTSTEKCIPIPDNYVDCILTINSLDHVENLKAMCEEIKRILKPQALLLGDFNLLERETECEPQTLTEEILREVLLDDFVLDMYEVVNSNGLRLRVRGRYKE